MAEFGDALSTAISQSESGKPAIFEVLAQDNLNFAIRPAIKHVIKVFAENYPQQLGWCQRWFHEWFTLLDCVIQHHFLSTYSASYAEYYYDLKRVPLKPLDSPSKHFPLGKYLHCLSITSLSIFPYIQVKLDEHYNRIKENYFINCPKKLSSTERALLFFYPYLHLTWNMAIFCYNFLYAIGKSNYHSPIYSALKLKLQYDGFESAESSVKSGYAHYLTKLLTGGVYAGVFIIQFMDWWFDENNRNSVKEVMRNPTPNPPSELPAKTNIPIPPNEICPLCNRHRRNDTALMTSGYVFCYVCIFKYVKSHQRCPVTGYRSGTNHLVKIYPPA